MKDEYKEIRTTFNGDTFHQWQKLWKRCIDVQMYKMTILKVIADKRRSMKCFLVNRPSKRLIP